MTSQTDLWPRCDQSVTTVTDLLPNCDQDVTTLTDLWPRCDLDVTTLTDLWLERDQDVTILTDGPVITAMRNNDSMQNLRVLGCFFGGTHQFDVVTI